MNKRTLVTSSPVGGEMKTLKNDIAEMISGQTQTVETCISAMNQTIDARFSTIMSEMVLAKKEAATLRQIISRAADAERLRAISVGVAFTLLVACVLFSTLSQRTAISACLSCAFLCTCFAFFRH